MDADNMPPALDKACDALDHAKEKFFEAVESWLLPEVAALSARLKGRTVTLYSGNGVFSIHIERRRPLTWGDYNARKAFIIYDHEPESWARWLPAPDLFAAVREVERRSEFQYVTPIGAFAFRDGQRIG